MAVLAQVNTAINDISSTKAVNGSSLKCGQIGSRFWRKASLKSSQG